MLTRQRVFKTLFPLEKHTSGNANRFNQTPMSMTLFSLSTSSRRASSSFVSVSKPHNESCNRANGTNRVLPTVARGASKSGLAEPLATPNAQPTWLALDQPSHVPLPEKQLITNGRCNERNRTWIKSQKHFFRLLCRGQIKFHQHVTTTRTHQRLERTFREKKKMLKLDRIRDPVVLCGWWS